MFKLFFLWLAIVLCYTFPLRAQHLLPSTPPAPYSITVSQPDGSTLQVVGRGNDLNNWMETEDGYTLIKNTEGFYEYANLANGKLTGSGIRAVNPAERSIAQQRQLLSIKKRQSPASIRTIGGGILQQLSAQANARTNSFAVVPTEGDVKILAILIEYPDLKHQYEKEDFEKLLNGPSDKPSFKSYFQENSHGKFNPTVDVVGWYQAKNNYDYYGEKYGKGRARELVQEAVQAAKADDVDFKKYNNDGDDDIDGVIIIHSGPGAEEGGDRDYIWSHRSTISAELVDATDKLLFAKDYTIQPEVRTRYNSLVGVGIFCHEFGHLLGLPDLYDTDASDDQHFGIGEWGLMGLGGWLGREGHPAGMSAFSKEQLGWAKVQDITDEVGSYQLPAANSNGAVYKITTPNSNEYFLLENRQKIGTDEYLKGSGLAVWHINSERTDRYPESIHVNNRRDFKGVDLEEADGQNDLDFQRNRGDGGDLFPGSSNRTVFDGESDPNSDLYEDQGKGVKSGVAIANIQLSGTTISFDYGSKTEDEIGSNCEIAVEAKLGDNTLTKENYWYTFTLPQDGRIIIESANAELYSDCEAGSPLLSSSGNQLTSDWLKKGETVKIKLGDKQPNTLPLTWKLSINSDKIDPALTVETISDRTYGDEPFEIKASVEGDGEVSYQRVSGPVTLTGNRVSIDGAGSAKVKVLVSETDEYAADEQEISFEIKKAVSTITFTAIPDKTFGDEDFSLQATSNPDFPISFQVKKGKVEIEDKTVSIAGAGEVEIEASTEGDENYQGATKSITFEIKKLTQAITFTGLEDVVFDKGKEIPLSAISDRDLAITFSVREGSDKVELNGQTLVIKKAGEVTVEASQGGNENIAAATPVRRTFEIAKAPQTITFTEIPNKTVGDEPFNLEATSSADIPIEFKVIEGNAELDGSQLTLTGSGEVIIEAYNEGNENYLAAEERQTFVVAEPNKQNQTITYTNPANRTFGDDPFSLDIQSSSALPISYQVEGPVEVSSDGTVTILAAGEVTIRAFQAGNEEYAPSETVELTFTIGKATQLITFAEIPDKVVGDASFTVEATSNVDIPMKFAVVRGNAEISENRVTLTGSGEVIIEAYNEGNQNYQAVSVQESFIVAEPDKKNQTITLAELPDTVTVDEVVTLDITVSSELNPDIDLVGLVVRNDFALTFTQAGEVTLRVSQPGNDEFNPAKTVTHTFVVINPAETEKPLGTDVQEISFTKPANRTYGDAPFPLEVQSSSELPITYEVTGPAEISEGILTILGAGEVTIRAFQVGNEEYAPSDTVTMTLTVNKAAQAITLEVVSITDTTFQIQASSDANLPVTIVISEGEGAIEGDILTITSPNVTVTATQEGNENYAAAEPVSREVSLEVITSLGNEVEEPDIVVYPNPSAGLFKVKLTQRQPVSYQVFTLQGALVIQGILNSVQKSIDMSDHRGGAYILRLRSSDGAKQYRIVKQ
ncbi:MAG: M6 family metalloprotease domain-containing protein [Bacteroidota bacterium]